MSTRDDAMQHKRALFPQTGSRWRQLLLLGFVALALSSYLAPRDQVRPSADSPGSTVALPAPAAAPPSSGARATFAVPYTGPYPGPAVVFDVASGQPSPPPPAPAEVRHSVVEDLVALVRQSPALTPEIAKDLKRRLQEIRESGTGVVPAIRDFLGSQQDVEFDKMPGGRLAEQRTLRLALIDTLREIGGPEAIAVSVEQLRITEAPSEIALLALNLEELAPGVYRDEVMSIVLGTLQDLARSNDAREVRPLFDALQALGGVEAMSILEQFPHNADAVRYLRNKDTSISPTVRTYALMTLAGLPGGEGLASLAGLAGDPNVPLAHRTAGPFQMLAQASAEQVQAADELLRLAQAKQIPDGAWNAVADALAGKHLQFPSPAANGSSLGASFVRGFYDDERNVLYEERLVSRTWSATRVQQQVAVIDALLGTTQLPAATQALQRARETLVRRRP